MMISIHGLPVNIKYNDLKKIIKDECHIEDFILDSLMTDDDGVGKKMRIGLADATEGALLMRRLDGFRINGHQLRVVPVVKNIQQPQPQIQQPASYIQEAYVSQPVGQPSYVYQEQPRMDPWTTNVQWTDSNQYQPQPVVMQPNPVYMNPQMQQAPREVFIAPQQQNFAAPQMQLPANAQRQPVPPAGSRPGLRNVELVDTPKPMTIAKDKFQGPTQFVFGSGQQTGPSPAYDQLPVQKQPYSDVEERRRHESRFDDFRREGDRRSPRRMSPDGRRDIPSDRRMSPNRRMSPSRRMSPRRMTSYRSSPGRRSPGRRISPRDRSPGRRISPGRRMSPERKVSPGRRMSPGQRMSPGRRHSPGRRNSSGRRNSPGRRNSVGRRYSPGRYSSDRRASPSRRISPQRRFSPSRDNPDRRNLSPQRRQSPPRFSPHDTNKDSVLLPVGRKTSPGRLLAPPARRLSPPKAPEHSARQISPSGREISPSGRRISPSGRIYFPSDQRKLAALRSILRTDKSADKLSPGNIQGRLGPQVTPRDGIRLSPPKLVTPMRRNSSPRGSPGRYSPSALYEDKQDFDRRSASKREIRPAYEPAPVSAPKPPLYTGAYRPNIHENIAYPVPGQAKPWPQDKVAVSEPYASKPEPFRVRDFARVEEGRERSRSPVRRERSPPRERFQRRSPSPRRSYEANRRSPVIEPPPPPSWPGQKNEERREEKRVPVWERLSKEPVRDDHRREDRREERRDDRDRRERSSEFCDRRREEDRRRFEDRSPRDHRVRPDEFKLDESPRRGDELRRDHEARKLEAYRREDRYDRRREEERRRSPERGRRSEREKRDREQFDPEHFKIKRGKARNVIVSKMIDIFNMKDKIVETEISIEISKILSRITEPAMAVEEMVQMFYKAYDRKAQDEIYRSVVDSLPGPARAALKLRAVDRAVADAEAKIARMSDNINKTEKSVGKQTTQSREPQTQQQTQAQPQTGSYNMEMAASLQQPFYMLDGFANQSQAQIAQVNESYEEMFKKTGYNLFLCKDDFEPIRGHEAAMLKDFLVAQIFETTASTGWAPNFTLKGLKSIHRYEVETSDPSSKDWLVALDFSVFKFFNVLVYTKEELWYERAAVWLPGHSRVRNIEPLEKLRLQNKHLDGVNIGKWKLVKKIVQAKGTRVYVDMPPSSARALEKHKMMLSYELQKVNVFLKAVAVDKNTFDIGLKEESLSDPAVMAHATEAQVLPLVANDPGLVKICFKGGKLVNSQQAKKIKDMILYHLYKYLQDPMSKLQTDFVKYGICHPGYFSVLPENPQSEKWLKGLDIVPTIRRVELKRLVLWTAKTKERKVYRKTCHKPLDAVISTITSTPSGEEKETKVKTEEALTEPRSDGEYELGPTLKTALQAELQDVMIKMWQALPDNATSPAEKLVVDKLKGEAGDDFGNVLGLNVTKRILELNNNLFVKVKFESFISGACLSGFLRRYRVHRAKKVQGQQYALVAQMKEFADFDALCTTTELVYDKVKFSVEPCYRFMTCPDTLRTSSTTATPEAAARDTREATLKVVNTSTKFSEVIKASKDKNEKTDSKKTVDDKETTNEKSRETSNVNNKDSSNETEISPKINKQENNGSNITKVNEIASNKVNTNETTASQKEGDKDHLNKHNTSDKTKVSENASNKVNTNNESEVSQDANKIKKSNGTNFNEDKANCNATKINQNANSDKLISKETKVVQNPIDKDDSYKVAVQNNAANKIEVKSPRKKVNVTEVKPNNSNIENQNMTSKETKSVAQNNKSISDDLDFDDMANLLAESIVLDECSGSDEE